MKFWTIQHRTVYEILNREGVYQPDFELSPYLAQRPDMAELYQFLHAAFERNNINLIMTPPNGLIFCFAQATPSSQSPIREIQDISQFTGLLSEEMERNTITSLLQHYADGEHLVMEINVGFYFNPIPVELHNLLAIMPPMEEAAPYSSQTLQNIQQSIWDGIYLPSPQPSGLIQVHLPAIIREMVGGVFPFS